jgi:acyl carrier protein
MQDSALDRETMPVSQPSTAEIESWLVSYLASLLALPEDEISRTLTFEQFGLDSAAAVAMTGDLARWLGSDLDPNLASKHKTIASLAGHLSG